MKPQRGLWRNWNLRVEPTHLPALALSLAAPEERNGAIEKATRLWPPIGDQGALMHDLIVYSQNRVLGRATGNAVPERVPNPDLPRIVIGSNGPREDSHHPCVGGRVGSQPGS